MRISGKQAKKVTLLKKSTTHDEYNQPVESWAADTANTSTDSSGKIYVERHFKGGDEGLESGQIVAWQRGKFKIRYISELDPSVNKNAQSDYMIRDGELDYDIINVQPINGREGMWIKLKARDND